MFCNVIFSNIRLPEPSNSNKHLAFWVVFACVSFFNVCEFEAEITTLEPYEDDVWPWSFTVPLPL